MLSAGDGVDGLELAIKELPNLILCDIHMPRMNGDEVFMRVRENKTSSNIPFVFVTSSTEKAEIKSAMEKGVNAYLCKPFDTTVLLDEIKVLMDRDSHS